MSRTVVISPRWAAPGWFSLTASPGYETMIAGYLPAAAITRSPVIAAIPINLSRPGSGRPHQSGFDDLYFAGRKGAGYLSRGRSHNAHAGKSRSHPAYLEARMTDCH